MGIQLRYHARGCSLDEPLTIHRIDVVFFNVYEYVSESFDNRVRSFVGARASSNE
jgi:hypothetical protein